MAPSASISSAFVFVPGISTAVAPFAAPYDVLGSVRELLKMRWLAMAHR